MLQTYKQSRLLWIEKNCTKCITKFTHFYNQYSFPRGLQTNVKRSLTSWVNLLGFPQRQRSMSVTDGSEITRVIETPLISVSVLEMMWISISFTFKLRVLSGGNIVSSFKMGELKSLCMEFVPRKL